MPLLGVAGALYLHAPAYDNCGAIEGTNDNWALSIQADVGRRWRAGQICLWEHYRAGQRAMLTSLDGPLRRTVFTVAPAPGAAPIHVALPGAGTAACRAMRNTGSGLEMEGCTWDDHILWNNLRAPPSALTLCWDHSGVWC
jgi:hypothetical protein